MSINVQPEGTIFCTCYQKSSDIGTILNYRGCAPPQHKKSVIQGTIHLLFRANSNWEAFHEALTKNEKNWENNQYPRHWVGQTCRHITTKVAKHAKADLPMGIPSIESNSDKTAFQWKRLDQFGNQSKLMTLKALYIRALKTAINTRDEYQTRELTLTACLGWGWISNLRERHVMKRKF